MNALAYDIRENLVVDRASGAYRFGVERDELRRFTAFVRFDFDEGDEYAIEEIDVDARDENEARDVARRALDVDYEPDGVIVRVEERFGWYL